MHLFFSSILLLFLSFFNLLIKFLCLLLKLIYKLFFGVISLLFNVFTMRKREIIQLILLFMQSSILIKVFLVLFDFIIDFIKFILFQHLVVECTNLIAYHYLFVFFQKLTFEHDVVNFRIKIF